MVPRVTSEEGDAPEEGSSLTGLNRTAAPAPRGVSSVAAGNRAAVDWQN
jgi:hypothetical protein